MRRLLLEVVEILAAHLHIKSSGATTCLQLSLVLLDKHTGTCHGLEAHLDSGVSFLFWTAHVN